VSAAALVLLTGWERRRADPLIELRVFRSAPFIGALMITVAAFACLGGFLFLTTLYLQDVRGLTVWQAGVQLVPLAAATAVAGPVAGRVMARRGARGPLTVAGVALAVSCLLLAQVPPTARWTFLAAAYVVFGVGYGAVNTVIAAVAVAGMPRARAGVAGGMTSAGRQVGQSLGVAAVGSILASGLRGPGLASFAAASHPAWLVIAACGVAVLLLSLVSTSRRPGRHYVGSHRRRALPHQQDGEQHPLPSRRYTDDRIPPYGPATDPARRTTYRPLVQPTLASASAEPATVPLPRRCHANSTPDGATNAVYRPTNRNLSITIELR
jgi:MFS family permease